MLAWRRSGSRRAVRRSSNKLPARGRSATDGGPTESRRSDAFDGRFSQGATARPAGLNDGVFLSPPQNAHLGSFMAPYNEGDVAAYTPYGEAGGVNGGRELTSIPARVKKPIFIGSPRPGINPQHVRTDLPERPIESRLAENRNADRSDLDRVLPRAGGGKPEENRHEWSAAQAVLEALVIRTVDIRYRRDLAAHLAQNEQPDFRET